MKNTVLCLCFLVLTINGFSQELSSEKKYDFSNILEQSTNNDYKFTVTDFYLTTNKNTVLTFVSYIVFPIEEEKDTWRFGENHTKNEYAPIINLDNFYNSIPKFTNFSPYAKQYVDHLQGKMKILKGYDFCGRPLY